MFNQVFRALKKKSALNLKTKTNKENKNSVTFLF